MICTEMFVTCILFMKKMFNHYRHHFQQLFACRYVFCVKQLQRAFNIKKLMSI